MSDAHAARLYCAADCSFNRLGSAEGPDQKVSEEVLNPSPVEVLACRNDKLRKASSLLAGCRRAHFVLGDFFMGLIKCFNVSQMLPPYHIPGLNSNESGIQISSEMIHYHYRHSASQLSASMDTAPHNPQPAIPPRQDNPQSIFRLTLNPL